MSPSASLAFTGAPILVPEAVFSATVLVTAIDGNPGSVFALCFAS